MSEEKHQIESIEFYQTPSLLERYPILQQTWGDSMIAMKEHYWISTGYGLLSLIITICFGLSSGSLISIILCIVTLISLPLIIIFVKNFIFAPTKVIRKQIEKIDEKNSEIGILKEQLDKASSQAKEKQKIAKEQPKAVEKSNIKISFDEHFPCVEEIENNYAKGKKDKIIRIKVENFDNKPYDCNAPS